MNESLPTKAVEEDHRLEGSATKASESLAKHRWHWTLDETNPKRVSIRAYARAIGRSEATIRHYVNGYAAWSANEDVRTLSESIERAKVGTEKETAIEAVAKARGQSFVHTRQERPTEVKRVRDMARERAEQRGTSVEEEAPRAAEWVVKAEKAAKKQHEDRTERLGLRFVEMERHLDAMKRAGTQALRIAHEVPWGDDERELLSHTVGNVKALLGLIDTALTGATDTDWDAELAKISAGER